MGRGLAKAIVFKEMYGAILEFPQGWERWGMGRGCKPQKGGRGMDNPWNYTIN